jgi:hypothetical protein
MIFITASGEPGEEVVADVADGRAWEPAEQARRHAPSRP